MKTALITGASRGIGAATARLLAQRGYAVAINYNHSEGRALSLAEELTQKGIDVTAVDALSLAKEAGSAKAVNIVLMGVLARSLSIPKEKWISAIENTVAPKFAEMNKKAFALGYGE